MSHTTRVRWTRSTSLSTGSLNAPFRPDVQGIRAIAVFLVIANHLTPWPSGGFIGVDVFFVVSGFVITGGLLRQQRETGWVSISAFYARRLRRIVPVAFVVAAVTVLVGFVLWLSPRALQTALDGLAATLWVSNWHFAGLGTDYLAASGPTSPFQHYWSLSVEEQFYLVMPWVVIALGLLAMRQSRISTRSVMVVGFLLFILVSFAWSVFLTQRSPNVAYFDTIGRSWEFVAGALVAALGSTITPRARIAAKSIRALGLAVILGSALILTAESAFPAPWAVAPVVGAVLVIMAGPEDGPRSRSLLGNAVAQYLGKISYSLYLWHFPVIIYLHVLIPDNSSIHILVSIVLMLTLSHLSFRFIEGPARNSGWLRSWEADPPRRSRKWKSKQALLGGVAALTVAVLAAAQFAGPVWVRSAVALTSSANTAMDQCWNALGTESPRFCYYGDQDSDSTVLVLGDSVAVSWIPTVAAAVPEWRTVGVGYASCPPFDIVTLPGNVQDSFIDDCHEAKERMYRIAAENVPDTVVLSTFLGGYLRQGDGATGNAATEKWASGVERTALRYKELGARVVILSSPPPGGDVAACSNRLSQYERCSTRITAEWKGKTDAEEKAAKSAGVDFVDVRGWFCEADETCPAVISGVVARTDSAHITEQMAEILGPRLAAAEVLDEGSAGG